MKLSRDIFKIVFGCCLVGIACADPLPPPPLPPPLKVYRPATGVTQGSGAAALKAMALPPEYIVIPPTVSWIKLTWDYSKWTNIVFNVYHSSRLSFDSMTLLATVATNYYSKVADQPMEFFGVKAYDTVLKRESTWATK